MTNEIAGLLRHAKTMCNCLDGVVVDDEGEAEGPCQYCHEVDAALAALQAEPVAWSIGQADRFSNLGAIYHSKKRAQAHIDSYAGERGGELLHLIPLYTTPQPAKVPDDFVSRLETQIAWRLEEQLCNGSIGPDQFVVKNRELPRELIEIALTTAPAAGEGEKS